MDKQKFRIDKNEKLIALLERRASTVTNNYTTTTNGTDAPQNIMGKPVIVDTVPKDGQVLVYDGEEKEWKAAEMTGMRGVAVFVSATEPTDAELNDIWIQP